MSRDLRRYARQTSFRIIIGAILLLLIVGDGLIYLIYGSAAALTGLLCILGALVPVLVIVGILTFMDWIVHRANRE